MLFARERRVLGSSGYGRGADPIFERRHIRPNSLPQSALKTLINTRNI